MNKFRTLRPWICAVLGAAASTMAAAPAAAQSEIVIHTRDAAAVMGDWQWVYESTAANGVRLLNPDRGAAKLLSVLPSPATYAEFTFFAEAGRPYRIWLRGKAQNNSWANDSVFLQFNNAVSQSGIPIWRTGSSAAAIYSVEACNGCGVSNWGWEDTGYGSLGPVVHFASTGLQRLRVQPREDGISLDQIVLSASTYLWSAPGSAKNDSTILANNVAPATATTTTTTTTSPASTTTSPSVSGVKLRVLEWNIHHGVGTDGVYNIDRLASWMASVNPDVILLNEVEKYTYWGNEDQPARFKSLLQSKTGRTWYTHFSQEFGQWSSNGKGHLILSTYPLEAVNHVTLTASSGLGGGGVASQGTITVNGRTINLLLTHLDPYDQVMRLTQAREVITWSSGYAENRILSGDMNAWPDQTSILEYNKYYYDAWTVAASKGTATGISGITPFGATKNGRIDYIFFSKNAPNLVVLDSRTPDTRDGSGIMPSDHRPVVTTFDVR